MSGSIAVPESTAALELRDLFGELGDLKRTRSAAYAGSIAERGFVAAWAALCAGQPAAEVMRASVAAALAAARLGDLDAATLAALDVPPDEIVVVRRRAFDAVGGAVDPALAHHLREGLVTALSMGQAPPFADALTRQPRAGATCPGKPRVLLEPPENHAEHCWAVAVFGVLLAPRYGADPTTVFLAALAHHLHNALMPDSGFTGEMLLGDRLATACAVASARALDELDPFLRSEVEAARAVLPDAETPEGRAFHAADVLDRVLQLAQHLRVATVTLPRLLDEWELVHAGPVKPFHDTVLAEFALP